MARVLLEDDQKDFLVKIVEASRAAPNHHFVAATSWESTLAEVLHPGLPGGRDQVFPGHINILSAQGLIHVIPRRSDRSFDVTPAGFQYYRELKAAADEPLEDVGRETVAYLDAGSFGRRYPEARAKWILAHEVFMAGESQEQFSAIGHHCREAMMAFASSLVLTYQPPNASTDASKTVDRVRAILDQQASRLGSPERPFLDALLAFWGTVNDLVQRQEHAAQREGVALTWEDGRRVVFQTANVMYEIDRALSLP